MTANCGRMHIFVCAIALTSSAALARGHVAQRQPVAVVAWPCLALVALPWAEVEAQAC